MSNKILDFNPSSHNAGKPCALLWRKAIHILSPLRMYLSSPKWIKRFVQITQF
jgi:hypothetical protein